MKLKIDKTEQELLKYAVSCMIDNLQSFNCCDCSEKSKAIKERRAVIELQRKQYMEIYNKLLTFF